MDNPNPAETERGWSAALEAENSKGVANLQAMTATGRALTPEENVSSDGRGFSRFGPAEFGTAFSASPAEHPRRH